MSKVEIEKHALWHGQRRVTYEQIKAALDERIESGELLEIDLGQGPEMISRTMLDLKHENIGYGDDSYLCRARHKVD